MVVSERELAESIVRMLQIMGAPFAPELSADIVMEACGVIDSRVLHAILLFLFPRLLVTCCHMSLDEQKKHFKAMPAKFITRDDRQAYKDALTARLVLLETKGVLASGSFRRSMLTMQSATNSRRILCIVWRLCFVYLQARTNDESLNSLSEAVNKTRSLKENDSFLQEQVKIALQEHYELNLMKFVKSLELDRKKQEAWKEQANELVEKISQEVSQCSSSSQSSLGNDQLLDVNGSQKLVELNDLLRSTNISVLGESHGAAMRSNVKSVNLDEEFLESLRRWNDSMETTVRSTKELPPIENPEVKATANMLEAQVKEVERLLEQLNKNSITDQVPVAHASSIVS
jgi:hypothetical protein